MFDRGSNAEVGRQILSKAFENLVPRTLDLNL